MRDKSVVHFLFTEIAPAMAEHPDVPVEFVVKRGPVTSTLIGAAIRWAALNGHGSSPKPMVVAV